MFNLSTPWLGAFAVAVALFSPLTAHAKGDCGPPLNPRLVDACTAIIGNPAESQADRSDALRWRAVGYIQRGDLDRALADLSANIDQNPGKAQVFIDRAVFYTRQQEDPAKAVADYDKGIALDPNAAPSRFGRATVLEKLGDLDRARSDYDAAIRLAPDKAGYWLARAFFRMLHSDMEGGVSDLSETLRLDPKNLVAYRYRGEMRGKRGDTDGAIEDFSHAIELQPDDAGLLINRAVSFAKKGDYESALADQDAVLRLQPDNARIRNMRAHLRFTVGRYAEAAGDFDDVVAKSPEYVLGKLLRYISHKRGEGKGDIAALRRDADGLDRTGFTWPIFAVYLGDLTPQQLRDAVKELKVEDNFGDCGVSFYLGQYAMVQGRGAEGLPLLQHAAEVCPGDGEFERDAAKAEVARLQAAK